MTRKEPTFSLFTRLKEPELSHVLSVDEMEQVVGEQIVTLLNTRQWISTFATPMAECAVSTINYGIPDFCRINLEAAEDRHLFKKAIAKQIKKYINLFSLHGIEIDIDRKPGDSGGVMLRIEGSLATTKDGRYVAYTIQIDPIARNFHI